MSNYSIPIILGTTRKDTQSRHVANHLLSALMGIENIETQLLDLREADFPLLTEKVSAENPVSTMLTEWTTILKKSNALIIVCPEYKSGYPGSLKNFLDFLPPGIFRYKPVGLSTVSAGIYAGTSCLAQLRQVVIAMAGMVIPDRFQVGSIQSAINSENEIYAEQHLQASTKFIIELVKYTQAISPLQND
jgi:azobenzene reductase